MIRLKSCTGLKLLSPRLLTVEKHFFSDYEKNKKGLKENPVPSNNIHRAFGFASLAAQMTIGSISQGIKNTLAGRENSLSSTILSKENAKKFADALCRMRGAALKVGQMISLQEQFLPPEIAQVIAQVRDNAHVMPERQLKRVMRKELGRDWQKRFDSFEMKPFAAASIGQVHKAVLKNGPKVAVKVQYPGMATSIESDLTNLKWLVEKINLFPPGLYIENIIKAARVELSREVDYKREAIQQIRMRKLLNGYRKVTIPSVFLEHSTERIIVAEFVEGVPIDQVSHISQDERNELGSIMLDVTLKELFEFRFMQTDPNWSNFLYDTKTNTLGLIDFGAAREYSKEFTDEYIQMVYACSQKHDEYILKHSGRLGFTTGYETEELKELHLKSGYVLGDPFRKEIYDFRRHNIVDDLSRYAKDMLKDRLTPPPSEAYTLHRKLSGYYLTGVKLGAIVKCKELFLKQYENYDWKGVDKDIYGQK